nr:sodium/proton-translocating pyrophosphatase [Streptomyces sp. DSM 41633]
MRLAVRSNVRVAAAAREATPAEGEPEKDLTTVSHRAMKIAFRTGGVVGMITVGLGLLGASGVVFGLLGYLLVRGFVDRRPWDVLIGIGVAVVYGSLLWGVLPTDSGISWQGHLFGLIGGVAAAFF